MDSKRTLSEISHLFLSEVRNRQSNGALGRSAHRQKSRWMQALI